MGIDAWLSLSTLLLCCGLLASNRFSADVTLLGGVTILLLAGVLTTQQALAGLANEGMVTVGVLYVVVAGLQETGAVGLLADLLLGHPRSLRHAQWRLMAPVVMVSAFLNNTPVVAMFIPAVNAWAKQRGVSVSKLMLPLTYAASAGGLCTLIGSSTNLVVHGLIRTKSDLPGFSIFELFWIGAPVVGVVIGYLLLCGRWVLPERLSATSQFANVRAYSVEMMVEPNSRLVGLTVAEAGLRHLPGLYLIEIFRAGRVLPAISAQDYLYGGDRLLFTGVVASVADLRNFKGLRPATEQIFKLEGSYKERCLVEAVVSDRCPLLGKNIRDGRFRSVYHAAILAVARNGEKISGRKIGDIVLKAGDTLLLEGSLSFIDRLRHSSDFFLVHPLDYRPKRHDRAPLAILIVILMVIAGGTGWLSTLKTALVAAGAMILTGCVSSRVARQTVEWSVLLVIAASLAFGTALEITGAATFLAEHMVALAAGDRLASLAALFTVTALLSMVITNNATAALMFPIAQATASNLGVSLFPFAVTLLVAASASFSTPIGYQTNLMVQGSGGYRFGDYVRAGVPLTILVGVVTVGVVPLVWPF
ncbi:MAG: SLC13 family permease [Magnetococcus sp. DMHC-6]